MSSSLSTDPLKREGSKRYPTRAVRTVLILFWKASKRRSKITPRSWNLPLTLNKKTTRWLISKPLLSFQWYHLLRQLRSLQVPMWSLSPLLRWKRNWRNQLEQDSMPNNLLEILVLSKLSLAELTPAAHNLIPNCLILNSELKWWHRVSKKSLLFYKWTYSTKDMSREHKSNAQRN